MAFEEHGSGCSPWPTGCSAGRGRRGRRPGRLVALAAARDVRDGTALLTTITTRLCLDELRSARRTREADVGPWLPEPVPTAELGPLETAEQRDAVSLGALTALEDLLAADAQLLSDGGGQLRAARRPVVGAEMVARFLVGPSQDFCAVPESR